MELNVKQRLAQVITAALYNENIFSSITGKYVDIPGEYACVPGLNCQYCRYSIAGCPLGLMQKTMNGASMGGVLQVWGILLLFGLLLGRMICGWGCPVGLLQDLLAKIPAPKFKKNKATYYLSYLKYFIGAVFVLAIPLFSSLVYDQELAAFCVYICPVWILEGDFLSAILSGNADNILALFAEGKFYILLMLIGGSIIIYRPFCRFICPLGAFYGLFNKVSLFGMKIDVQKCVNCSACIKACPMDCKTIGDRECISCGKCRQACHVNAISLGKKFTY